MNLEYKEAKAEDIERIYELNKQLIDEYENIEDIAYDKVLNWVHTKIESCLDEYNVIYVDGKKTGYYRFYKNEEGMFEIDDLYIFSEFQNKGIGSTVIKKCCSEVNESIMLYVFIKNEKAVSLYKRLGFEIVKTIKDSRYIMRTI